MKRFAKLALMLSLPVGAFYLARCGDTCSSKAADVDALPSNCTLQEGADVTVELTLCAKCSESSPTCVAEVRDQDIELDASFQECDSQKDCSANACEGKKVTCSFKAPAAGTYNLVAHKAGSTINQTVTVAANGATTCGS